MRKATHKEGADYLGLAPKTIANWRDAKKRRAFLIGVAAIIDDEKAKREAYEERRAKEEATSQG